MLLTVKEAAHLVSVTPTTIRVWIKLGKLSYVFQNGKTMINDYDLLSFFPNNNLSNSKIESYRQHERLDRIFHQIG